MWTRKGSCRRWSRDVWILVCLLLVRRDGANAFATHSQLARVTTACFRYPNSPSLSSKLYGSDDDGSAEIPGPGGSFSFRSLPDRQKGLLVLASVPLAWGTFEPAVRYVYALEPPVPAFVFSLAYYLVAAVSLFAAASRRTGADEGHWPVRGGFELGTYLFVGNLLQVLGLQTVPSDRAAFLLQLTTIFVPLAQATLARSLSAVSVRTWLGCGVALGGVAVMGLDGQDIALLPHLDAIDETILRWSTGDGLIVAAAAAYTFHCVRLELYAKTTSAVKLAASKAFTETMLSAFAVFSLVLYALRPDTVELVKSTSATSFALESGREIVDYIASLSQQATDGRLDVSTLLPAMTAIVWTGLVTVAYTIYAQSYGQRRIRPVTANLIYTVQPVCTAVVAWLLLGESMGPAGYLGGGLIGAAVLLVATDTKDG